MIAEDSILRHPPKELSRRQVLILDGIRYAADMLEIAYNRLRRHLQEIAAAPHEPMVADIAAGMLDAWSIVDSAHRFRDLVEGLPGLRNSPWKRLLRDGTKDIADLRNRVQHQIGAADLLVSGGQLWGYLSWMELKDGKPTGRWHMVAAGGHHDGDSWFFAGPAVLPFSVPIDRIRLHAFQKEVYLARTLAAVASASESLEQELRAYRIRPLGPPASARRGADAVFAARMLVIADAQTTKVRRE